MYQEIHPEMAWLCSVNLFTGYFLISHHYTSAGTLTFLAGPVTVVDVDDFHSAFELDVIRQRRVQVHFVYGQFEGHLFHRVFGREQAHCAQKKSA